MIDQVFSINGEEFGADDFGEILERLEEDGNVLGATYYTGTKLQRKASAYFLLDDVLEAMGDRAWDECGEYAQGFPDIGKEKLNELEKLVSDWLDANVEVNFYTVTNVQERKVTAADIKQQSSAEGEV